MTSHPIVLSVGGSIIIPKTGFDISFLKKFRALILSEVKKGKKFILIIGGGITARQYQQAAKSVALLSNEDMDWMGIYSTILNAQFVRLLFKGYAADEVVTNPTKKVKSSHPIIIAGGWKPGCSTDNGAVLLAKTYGAKEVYNLSNIEYVFDKDPNKFSDAKKIETIDWARFRKEIVGNSWVPGKNAPFDPIASKKAEQMKLKVTILQGTNLAELRKAIQGKKVKGTVIS